MNSRINVAEQFDLLVQSMISISEEKRYWLIRTQGGSLYDEFINNDFIALEHYEISLNFLSKIKDFSLNQKSESIKNYIKDYYKKKEKDIPEDEKSSEQRTSLIASQIYKFVYEVKKGDTVIIPSNNSEMISFGVVMENHIADSKTAPNPFVLDQYTLKKKVKWVKEVERKSVDPYLIRMFTAHQAINDVGAYAEVIERSVKDLYILEDEAHLIINVGAGNICATDLFGLGYDILKLIDIVAKEFSLDIKSSDLEVGININSPGKIDLKSKIRKTTLTAGLILFICGGGYEGKNGTKISTEGLPAVINAISDFLNRQKDMSIKEREMVLKERDQALKENIFEQYKDNLDIQQPEDLITLLKQVSDNKDLAK